VERLLLEHDAVAEVAVLGLSDDRFGQTIAALVVRKDGGGGGGGGGEGDAAFVRGLLAFGAERMAAYKLPRTVRVVEASPQNARGTVNKQELAARLEEEASDDAG
jgi:acyl-CoA synthetase (AMP-forming)/AMP-acid ligase II